MFLSAIGRKRNTRDMGPTEPIQIAGIVLDEHGDPLPGANISVKGKEKTGTITDMDGNFSMKSLAPKTTLIVSFMGYKSKEIVVAQTDKKMRISLEPDSESLDEVVVVGMGTQRKVSVVGAVTSVNPAAISAPSTSVANMLGGVVPGIIAVDRSGEPGQMFLSSGFAVSAHLVPTSRPGLD